MPRKGPAPRRELVADPIHKSVLVTQITNKVMLHGKRTVAEKIVYDAMDIIQGRLEGDDLAIDTVKRAIDNVKPPLEVRSRRVGGATYQVPAEVRPRRSTTLAIRWVVDYARARREKTMAECLANEIMDASTGLGAAMKKRDDIQKMADSNKAFAHYRW
ncbi:MAG: 30S ribosomal protein S7 [Actinobacteria bacterium]|nr:MAG: 30S ribosomal protein S7 [Actinomycetota bacterium]